MLQQQPGHRVRIAGLGSYLPGEPIAFDQIEQALGVLDEVPEELRTWLPRTRKLMKQLLGMEQYFYALDPQTGLPNETPSSLAAKAATRALEAAGLVAQDLELVIYAGASQDRWVCPPTSVFLQQALGIERCAELSIHSNCTSTYKALQVATDLIAYGRYERVLVASANQVSNLFHARTLNQAMMTRQQALMRYFLCDGAGAVVLTRDRGGPGLRMVNTYLESVGIHEAPQMYTRVGATTRMSEAYAQGLHHLTQDFNQVSQTGPKFFIDGVQRFVAALGLTDADKPLMDRLGFFLANVPADHLVSLGMDEARARFGFALEKIRSVLYSTVANRGYTGPAAVLITLDELVKKGIVQDGHLVASFVTESSKWMNAGFLLEQVGEGTC